jgi:hypothetical protein
MRDARRRAARYGFAADIYPDVFIPGDYAIFQIEFR